MKINKINILSQDELFKLHNEFYDEGYADGEKRGQSKKEADQESIRTLNRKIKKQEAELSALREARSDENKLAKLALELEDKQIIIEQKAVLLESREKRVTDRENAINSKEEANYKKGYADGVADGLRRISEITAKDRDNAMKVAMVAAASHTNPQVTSDVLQLADGTQNK